MGYTKEQILGTDIVNKSLKATTVETIVKYAATKLDNISELPKPSASNVGQTYVIKGVQYDCEETDRGVYEWVAYDKAGQVIDYQDASNKPKINGVTLAGDQVPETYGLAKSDTERVVSTNLTGSEYIPLDTDDKIDIDTLGAYVVSNFVDTYLENAISEAASIEIKYSNQKRVSVINNTSLTTVAIDLKTTNENGETNIVNIPQRVLFHNTAGSVTLTVKINTSTKFTVTVTGSTEFFMDYTIMTVSGTSKIVITNVQNPAYL